MTEQAETDEQQQQPAEDGSGFDLAVRNEDNDAGTLEVFPPARPTTMQAGDFLDQHVAMLGKAWRIADVVCQTPAAPQQYRGKPKEGTVAILYGAEIGLPPMASLQKVINIHGSPSLEARTIKGLLKSKGYKFRTTVKSDTEFGIEAWEPDSDRRTDPPDEVAHWTIDRAIQARYVPQPSSPDSLCRPEVQDDWVTVTKSGSWGSKTSIVGNMKYITDPTGMLEAKGTAEVCRSIAPEILLGLPYCSEERDDWVDDDEPAAPARTPSKAGGVSSLKKRAAEAAAANRDEEPQDAEEVPVPATGDPMQDTEPATREEVVAAIKKHHLKGAPAGQEGVRITGATGTIGEDLPGPAKQGATVKVPTPAPDIAPEPAPVVAPEPEPQTPEPATEEETDGPAATAGGEPEAEANEVQPAKDGPAPAAGPPAPGDIEMSADVRSKGEALLDSLLAEAELRDPTDCLAAVAEIVAKRPGATYRPIAIGWKELSNTELKHVVDVLRGRKQQGELYGYVGEAINAASLREAGFAEG